MPYDPDLVERIRQLVSSRTGLDERRMFGGVAFLVNGNMAVAASGNGGLMVRVPKSEAEALLGRAHVEPMVMGGREMRGWLRVADPGLRTRRQLQCWVERGLDFAGDLPPK